MRLVLAALAVLVAACSGAGGDDASDETVEPIVRATTHVVDATPGDDVRVEDARLVFRAAGHEDLLERSAGDVLACGGGAGFLRRVKGVRRDGDTIVIDTDAAALGDAVEQGHVRQHVALDGPGSLRPMTSFGGQALRMVVPPTHLALGEHGTVDVAEGEIEFTPELDLDLVLRRGAIDRLKVVASGDLHAALKGRFDLHLPPRAATGAWITLGGPVMTIASLPETHAVAMIGSVPVVVGIRVELVLDYAFELAGDASGDVDFALSSSVTAGVERRDGAFRNLSGGSFDAAPHGAVRSPSNAVAGDIVLSPRVSVRLYDVAGPYVALEAYAGIARDRRPSGDEWFGRVGLRGQVGVEAALFGHVTAGYRADLFDRSVKVALTEP